MSRNMTIQNYMIICLRPKINGDTCNRSNTLQVIKQPKIQISNDILRKSKRVGSKDKQGIKALQHIVNIGEKTYKAKEFRPKNKRMFFSFAGRCE